MVITQAGNDEPARITYRAEGRLTQREADKMLGYPGEDSGKVELDCRRWSDASERLENESCRGARKSFPPVISSVILLLAG
jgi:hypothetical protein